MSAPRKVTDAAILGAIGARQRSVQVGPTLHELAQDLGVSYSTVRGHFHRLYAAGVVTLSDKYGVTLTLKENPVVPR